ncbi:histidine kinase [Nonomuraea antimicrobica]
MALDERARIARELHDVLAHSLGALGVQLEVAEALLTERGDVDGAVSRIRRSRALARRVSSRPAQPWPPSARTSRRWPTPSACSSPNSAETTTCPLSCVRPAPAGPSARPPRSACSERPARPSPTPRNTPRISRSRSSSATVRARCGWWCATPARPPGRSRTGTDCREWRNAWPWRVASCAPGRTATSGRSERRCRSEGRGRGRPAAHA